MNCLAGRSLSHAGKPYRLFGLPRYVRSVTQRTSTKRSHREGI